MKRLIFIHTRKNWGETNSLVVVALLPSELAVVPGDFVTGVAHYAQQRLETAFRVGVDFRVEADHSVLLLHRAE